MRPEPNPDPAIIPGSDDSAPGADHPWTDDSSAEDPWRDPDWAPPDLGPAPEAQAASLVRSANPTGSAAPGLLAPLAAATDALARLDAGAAAASEAIRAGLVARLAMREAAGWLAWHGAWVHPLDLALHAAGLFGPDAQPNTAAARHLHDRDPARRLARERAHARALALARLLQDLARRRTPPGDAETEAALAAIGTGELDPARFSLWRGRHIGMPRRPGAQPPVPPLLALAFAAQDWMEAGIADCPSPAQALAAVALAAGAWRTRPSAPSSSLGGWRLLAVPLVVWAAAPALATGVADALPRLRSDARRSAFGAASIVGEAGWPGAFLVLVAEAAWSGARELDRLQAAAFAGARLCTGCDPRSRLAAALACVLREPAVTAGGLARMIGITPPAALRLLGTLAEAGIVHEITERRSFRAFAIVAAGARDSRRREGAGPGR